MLVECCRRDFLLVDHEIPSRDCVFFAGEGKERSINHKLFHAVIPRDFQSFFCCGFVVVAYTVMCFINFMDNTIIKFLNLLSPPTSRRNL